MSKKYSKGSELPLGLTMALAQNQDAMMKFTHLPPAQRQRIIDGTHSVHSSAEMRNYVALIAENEFSVSDNGFMN